MPAASLPRLLFISPTYPDTQGNGLAMRAAMFIEALAQDYRVSLLVVPCFGPRSASAGAFIAVHCTEEYIVEPRPARGRWPRLRRRPETMPALVRLFERQVRGASAALGPAEFDVIHAFRLYTAPLALGLATRGSGAHRPRLHLDLDDPESATHAHLARLYRLNRRALEAAFEASEAAQYLEAERLLLPSFERVYVCSETDAARISTATPEGTIRVVPNAVRPPAALPPRLTTRPFTFLFVGTLGYYPNEDAARYFCTNVLPLIRRRADRPFHVRVVGRGMPAALAELARIPEVRLVGGVPDVGLEYAEASAVVVPIRGGGGTRIKVLEAFAYRRPVVSTALGIEGIAAEPDRDFLLGNAPDEFAAQCLKLMADADLAAALVSHAEALLEARYTQERVNRLIEAWA